MTRQLADAKTWRRRALVVATAVLVLTLSAHPELFSLGAMVDALGVDGLLLLLEVQLTGVLLPMLLTAFAWCRPALHAARLAVGNVLLHGSGPVGQYGYLRLATRIRAS